MILRRLLESDSVRPAVVDIKRFVDGQCRLVVGPRTIPSAFSFVVIASRFPHLEEVPDERALFRFRNNTNLTSTNCLIQDLNCIEQTYNLISEDKCETTVFIHGYHSIDESMLNVISGLDPAGVIFYTDMYNDCQINPGVANLTDIFYTDGNGYGTTKEVGTLNIYANTGIAPQSGCESSSDLQRCGHLKAMEWYADAVRNETRYPIIKCPNCFMNLRFNDYCKNNDRIYLGPHINKKATGTYCLTVN
ncbi:hypothetical protein ACFW04_005975 [Cataglyphis niger]